MLETMGLAYIPVCSLHITLNYLRMYGKDNLRISCLKSDGLPSPGLKAITHVMYLLLDLILKNWKVFIPFMFHILKGRNCHRNTFSFVSHEPSVSYEVIESLQGHNIILEAAVTEPTEHNLTITFHSVRYCDVRHDTHELSNIGCGLTGRRFESASCQTLTFTPVVHG